MLYDSTKVFLRGILQALQSTNGIRWEDQLELACQCSYELHQMARPMYQGNRVEANQRKPQATPVAESSARAIPHVKAMARAIRRQDRAAALESGKAALAEL